MRKAIFLLLLATATLLGGCGGGSGGSNDGGISGIPSVTAVTPKNAPLNGQPFTLVVYGNYFLQGAKIQWNGQSLTTKEVSISSLTADIPSSYLGQNSVVPITVKNPNGAVSNAVNFTVGSNNPVPQLDTISPSSVKAGSGAFPLTAKGQNFSTGAIVRINGSTNLQTLYISPTEVVASIPAAYVSAPSQPKISVLNPAPGGGVSNSVLLNVTP